ncbi:MAG: hypothetical protein J5633_08230, partial [Oscillospiraceae bacterium]|nr:hypothetical protein [Oscillospiraceae bacterium]
MWWKKNKWKVIVPVLVIAALAAAFWIGGGSPADKGWNAGGKASPAPASAAPQTAAPAAAATKESADFTGVKLLIAEDNPINLEIAKMILSNAGFTVDTAENGREAL